MFVNFFSSRKQIGNECQLKYAIYWFLFDKKKAAFTLNEYICRDNWNYIIVFDSIVININELQFDKENQ